jgi:hypothetical protein
VEEPRYPLTQPVVPSAPLWASALESGAADSPALRPRRVRAGARWPGILSFLLGLTTMAGLIAGIVLATSDLYLVATYTAWGAVGASVLAVVLGLAAVLGRFGSGWAAAGLVLALIANPLVLVTALDLIGGLWA